ncbi:MAG: aminotransferase class IV family protein [Pseudoxanthomonas sp.]
MDFALLDGQSADADGLRALAMANYGHFTSMQVRGRAVRGLDLHLQRLRAATRELFGEELDEERVRAAMRAAVDAAGGDCSLRVTVFSRRFDHRRPAEPAPVDVLTTVSPPAAGDARAIRVKSFEFVRPLPHVKHVGTFPLFHYRRQALAAGFDDALFVDSRGDVVEGSVWNAGFWDGHSILWPTGPALRGTMEKLLQLGLEVIGVPQRWLRVRPEAGPDLAGAFAVNATGIQAIAAIDGRVCPQAAELPGLLQRVLETQPRQPL